MRRRDLDPGTAAGAPVGTPLRVTGVDLAPALAVRLAQCGVRVGGTVTVATRTAGGGRVLVAGTGRVAVDGASAAAVRVEAAA